MSCHEGATAEGSPYLGSIVPVIMPIPTAAQAIAHRTWDQ